MELRAIIRRARKRGLSVEPTKSGHVAFRDPQGRHIVTTGSTPSDWRTSRNLLAQLKRAGWDLRKGGKR